MESLVKSVLGNHIDGAKLVEVIQIQSTEDERNVVRFFSKDGKCLAVIYP